MKTNNTISAGVKKVASAQPPQKKVSNNDVAITYRNGHTTSKVIATCIIINTIVAVVDIAIFKPDLIEKGVRKMKNLLKSNKE